MKKILIILGAVAVTAGGYFAWNSYSASYSAADCSADHCSGYNSKMSMMCEHSCGAKNVDKTKVVAQSHAAVGDFTQCPVSGVVFLVTNESVKIANGDKTAFTCCGTCAQIFNESPGDYLVNIN